MCFQLRSFIKADLGLPAAPGVGSHQGSAGWKGPSAGQPSLTHRRPAKPQQSFGGILTHLKGARAQKRVLPPGSVHLPPLPLLRPREDRVF